MNKMKKLLSVLLAVLMILSSMTVMASAAKTEYKTVESLTALGAYSVYGGVTKLTTEARMSMIFDQLDIVLGQANINPGTIFNALGLSLTVDLRSVNAICGSLDNVKSLLDNWLVSLASGLLGIIADLNFDNWTAGMTREGTDQLVIVSNLAQVLGDNKGVVYNVISTGELDLGLASSAVSGLDLSIIGDIPGLIKPMIFGMFERWDDTKSEIQTLETNKKNDGNVESTIIKFVKDLFTNDMSITTVKADSTGNVTSHNLPGADADARVRYIISGTTMIAQTYATQSYVDAQAKLGKTVTEGSYYPTAVYILEQEVGTEDYIWAQVEVDEEGAIVYETVDGVKTAKHTGQNLKYYEPNSPFLPSLKADIEAGVVGEIDLGTMSAAQLLYTFIPYVFEEMAPVVLNGSMKKILGGFFGANYTKVGNYVDGALDADAAAAIPAADQSAEIFTMEQGEYLWEWSYYQVVNGNHYYRYEDQIFTCDTSNANGYFDIINWEYNFADDFMDEFVPANGGSTSDTLLMNLNDFLVKFAKTVLSADALAKITLTEGDNSNIIPNIKSVAQTIISHEPQSIFGSDYATNSYYNLLMSDDNQTILTGIAATVVDLLMPQMILPSAANMPEGTEVGAILAAVVRELATQLTPETNYDALIYSDYNTKTFVTTQADGTAVNNEYWLDVIMTMGVDIGVYYLHNIIDFGGDTDYLVSIGWGYGKTYAASEISQTGLEGYWEAIAGYVVSLLFDDVDGSYRWNASVMFDYGSSTSDLWQVLGKVLSTLLPIDNILNVDTSDTYWLETTLRDNFILSLVNLEWTNILDLLVVPDGYLRTTNVLDQLALAIKGIVNSIFYKVGGSYSLLPSGMTDLDTLANQANLAILVRDLLGALKTAYDNGLVRFVLPIVNLLLGWKVTAQAYSEPLISLTYESNMSYLYTGGDSVASATLNLVNNSSGMLLTHRTSDKVDSPYILKITNVSALDATVTVNSGLNTEIHPGLSGSVAFDVAYTADQAVTLKIEYEFTGKSGVAIGGTQVMYVQTYMSSLYADSAVEIAAEKKETSDSCKTNVQVTLSAYKPYWFINDLAAVENFGYTFTNNNDSKNVWVPEGSYSGSASAPFSMLELGKWVHGSSEQSTIRPEGVLAHTKSEDTDISNQWTLYPYIYDETSTVEVTPGTKLNLPTVTEASWKNSDDMAVEWVNVLQAEFYYYDLTPLTDVYDGMAGLQQEDFNVSASVWNTFKAARDAAVKLIMGPMMRDTFTTLYSVSNVQAVADNLQAAYDALIEAEAAAGSSAVEAADTTGIETNLEKDDDTYGVEINYQDYVLYEYFKYEDVRTLARNILKEYTVPTLIDKYYIEGSGISLDELDNHVIANESNEYIAAGIEASKSERTEEEMAASQAAIDAYVAPAYTKLYLDDVADKLDWYRQFIEQDTVVKQFLAKEIAYADYNYNVNDAAVEALYTADSWAKYKSAYEYAVEVNAGTTDLNTLQSTTFNAKYELMVAMKNLLLKSESLIEQGGTTALLANMDTANEIFAGLVDGTWVVKEGVDANEAYAQLISALGYNYTGLDGYEYNLYADSAIEYATYDRPNTTNNQAKVNGANTALEAAIANFESAASPELLLSALGEEIGAVISRTYGLADGYDGIVMGIDTLMLGYDGITATLADSLTTPAGSININTDATGGIETTGTLIELCDTNGTVLETYVFVYFGDINADGVVDSTDASMLEEYSAFISDISAEYLLVAGDVNSDGMVDSTDASVIEEYSAFIADMPLQATAAEYYAG